MVPFLNKKQKKVTNFPYIFIDCKSVLQHIYEQCKYTCTNFSATLYGWGVKEDFALELPDFKKLVDIGN